MCCGGDTLKVFVNIHRSRPPIQTGRWRRCRSARPVLFAPGCRSSLRRWRSAPLLCYWPRRCPAAWPPGWSEWVLHPACWRWTSRGEHRVWLRSVRALALSRRVCPPWGKGGNVMKIIAAKAARRFIRFCIALLLYYSSVLCQPCRVG